MSRETLEWLNNNVLVGFTEDREKWAGGWGNFKDEKFRPWHAQDGYTGGFLGPIPIEIINERLFSWEAIEAPLVMQVPCDDLSTATGIDADGRGYRNVVVPDWKAIARSDNDYMFKPFKDSYRIHQYREWLIDQVGNIVDDETPFDSAGLLQQGGIAWCSISLPESLSSSTGFAIRPRILAFTSHNGRHSTTYARSVNAPVCDNSLDVEIRGAGADRDADGNGRQVVKIKHSANSNLKLASARDTLGLLYKQADEMLAFFDRLAEWEVNNVQFKQLLDVIVPVPEMVTETNTSGLVVQTTGSKRSQTIAENKRGELAKMYVADPRASQWQGTALGVLQAFNTWDQQDGNRGGAKVERQMLDTLSGDVGKFDGMVLGRLADVTEFDIGRLVAA